MHVEIWSDIACPWCYVGKRRLEAALAEYEHADEVEVTWRAFELDPGAPAERGGEMAQHLADKYGVGLEQARQMNARMSQAGAEVGAPMDFDRVRGGNTFDAHRLVHLAAAHGLQDAMKERLLRAYFAEGELMADPATLRRLADEVGVPADEVADLLSGDRFADEVRDDERTAQQLGVQGVPFFAVDRAIGASGAQEPEVLLDMLREARRRSQPAIPTVVTGDACGPDGC